MAEERAEGQVVIDMPAARPSRFSIPWSFSRLLNRSNRGGQAREVAEEEEMREQTPDAWLATGHVQEVNDDDDVASGEEPLGKTTVKLESIALVVNILRSPIKIDLRDGKWYLSCFADGTMPYQVELWIKNRIHDKIELPAGIASECKLVFSDSEELNIDEAPLEINLAARVTEELGHVISQGRILAGVQVSNLQVCRSRDGKSYEAKLEKQKILISNFEMDLFEIYGQPHHTINPHPEQHDGANKSQTSFFSSNNPDLPGYNRECVICLTQRRDTLFLPCRHMCLCLPCAESLCLHSDKCPICRQGIQVSCPYAYIHNSLRIPFDAQS